MSTGDACWSRKTIEELCIRVTSGGTPNRSNPHFYSPGTVPWVKTGDLRDSYVVHYDEYISEAGVAGSSAKMLPRDTVLMAMYGATVGMLGMLSEPATCNQASCAMVADPSVCDPRWLFYALLNDREFIVSQATGAAQQNLSGKTIKGFSYCAPSVGEQHAIAEVLGAFDDKIAANIRLAGSAEELAISLLSPSMPSILLGEAVVHYKKSVSPERLSATRVAHFSLPAFDTAGLPEFCSPPDIKSNKFLVERPSVLVSKLNPRVPRIWNIPTVPEQPALASTEFLVLEPIHSSTSVLWAILRQPAFGDALESKVAGTSGSHQRVKPDDLLATQIIDPRELRDEIKEQITSLGSLAVSFRAENAMLAATRDALLPQLMSGKLRVKDAEAIVEDVA